MAGILLIWWYFLWRRNYQVCAFGHNYICYCEFKSSLLVMLTCYSTELPDRTNAAATLLLPLSTKDNKDGRTKEENHKLLNGNSVVDPADWVCWMSSICPFFSSLLMWCHCLWSGHNMVFVTLLRGRELKQMVRFWKMAIQTMLTLQWMVHRYVSLCCTKLRSAAKQHGL